MPIPSSPNFLHGQCNRDELDVVVGFEIHTLDAVVFDMTMDWPCVGPTGSRTRACGGGGGGGSALVHVGCDGCSLAGDTMLPAVCTR